MVRGRLIFAAAWLASAAGAHAQTADGRLDIEIGKNLFDRTWISAPASTKADDGLGPLSDASSCLACHPADTPYRAPGGSIHPGIVIRLGSASGRADPVYGVQLQTRGVRDVAPEVRPDISWTEAGGLRAVALTLVRLGYGPLAPETRAALRRAPNVAGIGLLARVPETEILTREIAPETGDGISGRPAWIADLAAGRVLGRFGWRASQPTLTSQTEAAFSSDLGLSTSGRPVPWGECSEAQTACRSAPHGAEPGEPEISDAMRDLIVKYLESVPPPPLVPPGTPGARIFDEIGCSACHAVLRLADGTPVPAYTDLLLHDMGPGLNDGIKEGAAEPGEWRTAPLWGLSATLKLGGLLHDGRAPDVKQAIEWHDGEAARSREAFRALSQGDMAALLAFLDGL